MNRPQIIKLLDKKDLKKVPSKFSVLVGRPQIGQTLIIIDGDEDKVATSKEVNKIINKIKPVPEIQYTIVITNLTSEAAAILFERKINILRVSNFYWTDDSYSKRRERTIRGIEKRMQQLHDESENEI